MGQLSNKVVLVTGANSGIGLEASVKFARQGATLVMVGRSREKIDVAVAEVTQRAGLSGNDAKRVSSLLCDFSSQTAIHGLAEAFRGAHARLDVLVNNAGSVNEARRVTSDGLEQTFAVNHLGYFILTNLLLDRLKTAAAASDGQGARIVNVASVGHRRGELDFDDLQLEKGYDILRAYNRSKLANVLFTRELAKKLEGTGIIVNSLHPGVVATRIWNHAAWWAQPLLAVGKLFMISPEKGGDTIVYLAVSPEVAGKTGGYYEKNRLVEPAPLANDATLAHQLWRVSASLSAGVGESI